MRLEERLEGLRKQVELALNAADKAVTKAETSVNDRLSAMNEFRGALGDAAANNVTRSEFEQFRQIYAEQHIILRDQHAKELADLKERLDRAEGHQGGVSGAWGVIIAVAGIAVAVGALVLSRL